MKLDDAIEILSRVSGWRKSEVVRCPDDCLWAASGVLVEARNAIRESKQKNHPTRRETEL